MRILIIEDERKMAGALKKGLEAENHCVSLAFDGREGLELASTAEFLELGQYSGFGFAFLTCRVCARVKALTGAIQVSMACW